MKIEVALISVSNREGVTDFARRLAQMGVRILSTGGTGEALREGGVAILPVAEYTGFPEILGGRVKTLHPKIHAGILSRADDPEHRQTLKEHGISAIGLVVVNLYPFSQTIARPSTTLDEAVEQIDIGGPAMVRAAAKNFKSVAIVVDPADYPAILDEMEAQEGMISEQTRFALARKAFAHTAAYDAAVASYLEITAGSPHSLPDQLLLPLEKELSLRYGENPHQPAALYRPRLSPRQGLLAARQLQGKTLSFNNFLDLEAALALTREFADPFCAIIKHTNPCGAALGNTAREAFENALASDSVSAFGSIIGFNRLVDGPAAEAVGDLFVEAVLAPGFSQEALESFSRKKNLRVMELGAAAAWQPGPWSELDLKTVSGGFLVQTKDLYYIEEKDLKTVTVRQPERSQLRDLLFAWKVCKHVKSNAIVLAREGRTVGIGAGQMSRVDSVRLAVEKAQSPIQGCVLASDAFFPFRDGVDASVGAGVRAIIQPGGSMRDEEVIQAADEHGISMVFTGVRHFKH